MRWYYAAYCPVTGATANVGPDYYRNHSFWIEHGKVHYTITHQSQGWASVFTSLDIWASMAKLFKHYYHQITHNPFCDTILFPEFPNLAATQYHKQSPYTIVLYDVEWESVGVISETHRLPFTIDPFVVELTLSLLDLLTNFSEGGGGDAWQKALWRSPRTLLIG